jgi:hypothetical protein
MVVSDGRVALIILASLSASACVATAPRTPLAAGAFADADSTATTHLAAGVAHTLVLDARGPWAVHIIEVDAVRCEPVLEARKPGSVLDERATTSSLVRAALAGINADFFMLPGGTPVGAHVTAGVALVGPTDRPVFAVTRTDWRIGTAHLAGFARVHADSAAITQVNRPDRAVSAYRATTSGLTLFTAWIGDAVPADSAAHGVVVRLLEGDAAAGRGVVMSSAPAAVSVRMRPGTAVLLAHGRDRAWAQRRTEGDTVRWQVQVTIDAPVREAVGGFPELLRDGRAVLAEQGAAESFSERRHPRTAIGWTADRRLVMVVVDGRRPGWSDGMTLKELTWLFQRLGVSDALNLDGGGSTAMVVNGSVVNRPSDREGERAVGNALALTGCRQTPRGPGPADR